jgi:hypothetical protein
MNFRVGQWLHQSARRPSLAGTGLTERMRSTTFALLGITAAAGLGLVAIFSHQGWPLLSPSPFPVPQAGTEAVQPAVAVSRHAIEAGSPGSHPRSTASGDSQTSLGQTSPGGGPSGDLTDRQQVRQGAPAGPGGLEPGGSQPTPAAPRPTPAPSAEPAPSSAPTSAPAASPPTPEVSTATVDSPGKGHAYGHSHSHGYARHTESAQSPSESSEPPEAEPAEPSEPEEESGGRGYGHGHGNSWKHGPS